MSETSPKPPPCAAISTAEDAALHHACDVICQTALATYRSLGAGRPALDYARALSQRLRRQGVHVDAPTSFSSEASHRDGEAPALRMLIDGSVVLQIHAQRRVDPSDEGDLLDVLDASGVNHGAILNFGEIRFLMKRLDRQG